MSLDERQRRRLADIIEDDLGEAKIRSASVTVSPGGEIVVNELFLRYPGRLEVALGIGRYCDDLIMEVHEDEGWRRMTIGRDYADELEEMRP